MNGKTILILGGGIGGLVAATELSKRLGQQHRLVVVDRNREHYFPPAFLGVMLGEREPAATTLDLGRRLGRLGVTFVQAQVTGINTAAKTVQTTAGEQSYDYLIIALGAELAPEAMPGFSEAAHTPYDLAGATRLRDALRDFNGGRVAVVISSMPFKCPAAPFETALLLDDHFRRHGLRERIEMQVYNPGPLPMGVAGPEVGHAVVSMLEAKGIGFVPGAKLAEIDPAGQQLLFSNREPAGFDFLVGVPPHQAPAVVRQAGLANEAGWVPVDIHTLATKAPGVYAIGDIAFIKLPNGKRLPLAGVFAHGQAQAVGRRIAAEIERRAATHEFDGLGYCWIEMGGGVAGFAWGDFYATPDPVVDLKQPGQMWRWGKVLFEKWWLGEGLTRSVAGLGLRLGSKALGIPASL
ncbi:MAG: NAD(P)/FAD-dependent oxidoreductase [Anaerolineae bacterium]